MNKAFDNITLTTSTGIPTKINISDIAKSMKELAKTTPPKILVMDIQAFISSHLTENTIILSKDVGDALEKALKENKNG